MAQTFTFEEAQAPAASGNTFTFEQAQRSVKFSPDAVDKYKGDPNAKVVYMAPADYLRLSPPFKGDPQTDAKGRSLAASLDNGDPIDAIPTFSVKDGRIMAQDGRHRALEAQKAGLDKIPVAIIGDTAGVDELRGMGSDQRISLPALGIQPTKRAPLDELKRQAGLTARYAIEGAAGLPLVVGDTANRLLNLLPGVNLGMPSEVVDRRLSDVGLPEPATTAEKVVGGAARALTGAGSQIGAANALAGAVAPSARAMLATLGANSGSQAAAAASGGAAQGFAEAQGAGPVTQMAAGLAGSLAPGVAAAATTKAMRPVKSFATEPHNELVRRAEDMGFDISAGTKTRNERLKAFESTLGSEAGDMQQRMQANRELFGQRVLENVGVYGEKYPTADILFDASKRIGNDFKALTKGKAIALDKQFAQDVDDINNEYIRTWTADDKLAKVMEKAKEAIRNRAIDGQEYQRIRSALQADAVSKIRGGDANAGRAVSSLAEALDNAAERSLGTADLADWQTARRQWRNLLVLEDALSGSKDARAGTGDLSPTKFAQAVERNRGKKQMSKTPMGADDMVDLARVGSLIQDSFPSSGTSERTRAMQIMRNVSRMGGAAVGGGAGAAHGGPSEAVGGAALGSLVGDTVLPMLISKAMLTGPMQEYLANGVLPGVRRRLSDVGVSAPATIPIFQGVR